MSEVEKYISYSKAIAATFCHRWSVPPYLRDDFISHAHLCLINCLENYVSGSSISLKTYISIIIKYRLIDLYRSEFGVPITRNKEEIRYDYEVKSGSVFIDHLEDEFWPDELTVNGTEQKVVNKDLAFKLLDGIKIDRRKKRVYKVYFEDKTNVEVAEEEGVHNSAISMDVLDGLKQMRKRAYILGVDYV